MNNAILLQTSGRSFTTRSGRSIVLRGVGLGGWMNMENFITGYPATEDAPAGRAAASARARTATDALLRPLPRRVLRRRRCRVPRLARAQLGPARRQLPPLRGRHATLRAQGGGFLLLDRAIDRCARHGLYTIIDLHALPGCQNQHWHSDNPTHRALVLDAPTFPGSRRAPVGGARRPLPRQPLGRRLQPDQRAGRRRAATVIGPFYERLHNAIRAVDPRPHPVPRRQPLLHRLRHVRRAVAEHRLHRPRLRAARLRRRRRLPRREPRAEYVDRDVVEETFLRAHRVHARRPDTPIWVGEFGPVYTGDPRRRTPCATRCSRDQLEIYRQHDASWALWTYKDIGLQGLVYAAPDSPYLRRIAPVLEKKARLGVDAWGSSDTGVRHSWSRSRRPSGESSRDSIRSRSAAERGSTASCRTVLLAEPLVDDFARCFAGRRRPTEAAALADSFRFDACLKRERLLDILRSAATP